MTNSVKSQAFFVVSNYNTNPYELTKYCDDYLVFDQSDDVAVRHMLVARNDPRILFTENSGTSLINYLTFIIDNYEDLPRLIAFLKGNLIDRHIPQAKFERLISNGFYTYLWHEDHAVEDRSTVLLPQANNYLERNNSWYVGKSQHRYFVSFDEFMGFFFSDYSRREFVNFCPGANFIVERDRVIQHPKSLYVGLRHTLEYSFFPSEAWMVERAFNLIFAGELSASEEILKSDESIIMALNDLPDRRSEFVAPPGPLSRVRLIFHYFMRKLRPTD